MFSDFPSLHPLIIHFPVVLILISVAFQCAVVWKNWEQIHWVTLLVMGSAFLSALAASTIFHADPSADAPKSAMVIFEQHETFAQYTLWMSGFTVVLKTIGHFYKLYNRSYQILVLVSAIVSAVFLSIAGHHGAKLTHVAGVGPMGRYLMREHGMDMEEMKDNEMDKMMLMHDSLWGDEQIPGKDSMIDMKNRSSGKNPKDMEGMKDMNGMGNINESVGKNNRGMTNSKTIENTDSENDMQNMNNMKGMKTKNMKSKNSGKTMTDMDNMPGMKSDKSKNNMPNMNMSNPLDTFEFEDNNPAFERKKK